MCDIMCDVNYYVSDAYKYVQSYTANDESAPCCINLP